MSWADELPRIRAEDAAWRAKHGPALKARDEQQAKDRERFAEIVVAGCKAQSIDERDAALVFAKTGIVVKPCAPSS